MNPVYELETL